jgi:hypothetical protein
MDGGRFGKECRTLRGSGALSGLVIKRILVGRANGLGCRLLGTTLDSVAAAGEDLCVSRSAEYLHNLVANAAPCFAAMTFDSKRSQSHRHQRPRPSRSLEISSFPVRKLSQIRKLSRSHKKADTEWSLLDDDVCWDGANARLLRWERGKTCSVQLLIAPWLINR